ncbi:hypothetical protein pb186bvf_011613 [Paramecium bursaria]
MNILIFCVFIITQAIQFGLSIPKKELRCFGDAIGQNILVVGQVSCESQDYSFKIYLPSKKHDNVLHYSHSQNVTKFSFTTNYTQQNYQFCIHNLATKELYFNYSHAIGTEANDFTLLAQKEDLKPIEVQLKKLGNIAESVENDYKSLDEKQQFRLEYVDKISYKIVIFSVITLGLMVSTNLFQYNKMKRFFKQKKLI